MTGKIIRFPTSRALVEQKSIRINCVCDVVYNTETIYGCIWQSLLTQAIAYIAVNVEMFGPPEGKIAIFLRHDKEIFFPYEVSYQKASLLSTLSQGLTAIEKHLLPESKKELVINAYCMRASAEIVYFDEWISGSRK